ncbi:MAG: DUF2125 domain-containing protein [Pseudomonadota bacterium]
MRTTQEPNGGGAPKATGRPNRLFLYGPLAVGGLLLAGWWGVWRAGTAEILNTAEAFIAGEAEHGVTIDYGDFSARGFPFFWRGAFQTVTVRSGDIAYGADTVFIDALPYDLNRVIFSSPAPQTITIGATTVRLENDDGRASVERDKDLGWLAKIASRATTAQIDGASEAFTMGPFLMNVKPAAAPATDQNRSNQAIDVSLTANDIVVEQDDGTLRIDRTETAFQISDLETLNGPRLSLNGAAAAIGDSRLYATGDLRIDRQGYLVGQLSTRLEKPADLAEALQEAGVLSAQEASAFAGATALAALASGGEISAPLSFENGEMSFLGFRLGEAPRIRR